MTDISIPSDGRQVHPSSSPPAGGINSRPTLAEDHKWTMHEDDQARMPAIRAALETAGVDLNGITNDTLAGTLRAIVTAAWLNGWDPRTEDGLLQAARHVNLMLQAQREQAGAA